MGRIHALQGVGLDDIQSSFQICDSMGQSRENFVAQVEILALIE